MDKDHLVDLGALRNEVVEFITRGNVFDDIDVFKSNYQCLDVTNNRSNSETYEVVMMKEERKKRV